MKGFSGRFKQFYAKKGAELLSSTSSIALFKREVNFLFDEFKKYIAERNESPKGLKLKNFEKILEDEGFILVTKRK